MGDVAGITSEQFESEVTQSVLPVLVDISAEWCPPCKMIDPVLDELSEEFVGRIKFCRVDVDTAPDIAERFGIRGVPTLLLFKGGDLVETLVGFKPKRELEGKLNGLLGE